MLPIPNRGTKVSPCPTVQPVAILAEVPNPKPPSDLFMIIDSLGSLKCLPLFFELHNAPMGIAKTKKRGHKIIQEQELMNIMKLKIIITFLEKVLLYLSSIKRWKCIHISSIHVQY